MPLDISQPAAARGFPIRFRHVPPAPRPSAKASEEEKAAYKALQKQQNLSVAGAAIIRDCRADLDARAATDRTLIVSVDGSYTNRTVLKNLPERTTIIGRIRKDAKFSYPPSQQPDRGRRRCYADPDLAIETVIQDYFWRWDIEVNHRDEKQLIGVGQAQVRSELSVELVPAFAVASYSMLLLASAKLHGFEATQPNFEPPKWRRKS